MRDPYADNNFIDYYTIIFSFVTYWLLDLRFSFHGLPSNDPQLSWDAGLAPAKSGPSAAASLAKIFYGKQTRKRA